ncbi:MAG: hypothetical protein ACNI27_13270 [Desulfovibrio sp.]
MKRNPEQKLQQLLRETHNAQAEKASAEHKTMRYSVMQNIAEQAQLKKPLSDIECMAPKFLYGAMVTSIILLCASLLVFNNLQTEYLAALTDQSFNLSTLFGVSL